MSQQPPFSQLEAAASLPLAEYLDRLAQMLRAGDQHHELFEVLKMKLRYRLGLPLLYDDRGDELSPHDREELERGLLDACREVGEALFRAGKPAEGWMYLRAVGDQAKPAKLLRAIEVTEERVDELIQVGVYEAIDMEYGFRLLLQHYGICNAITTFEQIMSERSRTQQQAAAGILVEELYSDLTDNVAADRSRREGQAPPETRLVDLISDHEELFQENAYHIDTSHLAAVVRFARLLEDPGQLQLGWELSQYGLRLAELYQLPDMSPFEEYYPAHAHYFSALLRTSEPAVEEAVAYFRQRADDVGTEGGPDPSAAREVYLDLLIRLERTAEALEEAVRLYPDGLPRELVSMLLELATASGETAVLLEYARAQDDLLTFGTLLALRKQRATDKHD